MGVWAKEIVEAGAAPQQHHRMTPRQPPKQRSISRIKPTLRYGFSMSKMYDLTMPSITGEAVALDQYRDKVSLIVNVASA